MLCLLQGGRLCCLKRSIPRPPSQNWHVPAPRLAAAAQGDRWYRAGPAAELPWLHKEQLFLNSSWMCKKTPLRWEGGSSSSSYSREADVGGMGPGAQPTTHKTPPKKPQHRKEAAEAQSRASLCAGSRIPAKARRGFLCRR